MIYLASPYTHSNHWIMERRFDQVMTVTAHLINAGHIIYSPILHFHPIAQRHDLPRNFEFWKEVNTQILSRCDALWVLKLSGWAESEGVAAEIAFATEKNIPVEYRNPAAWLAN